MEEITANIQNNDTPLEDALKQYEEGRKLVLFCRQKLGEVEQKLSILDNDMLNTAPNVDKIFAIGEA